MFSTFILHFSFSSPFKVVYFGSLSSVLKMDISQSTSGSRLAVCLGLLSLAKSITWGFQRSPVKVAKPYQVYQLPGVSVSPKLEVPLNPPA